MLAVNEAKYSGNYCIIMPCALKASDVSRRQTRCVALLNRMNKRR
jgi:hypothetical protein